LGVPPPPSSSGGDGSWQTGDVIDGDGEQREADWNEESSKSSDCGDTGDLPGGIGGMGQDGECIESGGASPSDAEDSNSTSSGGGGSEGGIQGTGGAGGVGEFPEESDAERAERLGQELDSSIGEFDEVLMEKQQEVASVGRVMEGFDIGDSGMGAEDSGSSGGGISLGQQSAGAANRGGITVNNTGIARSSPTADLSEDQISTRTPDDVVDLVDDDIIARQLREAALSEDDPVLRERLWVEYRKYRGLLGGE
jgi:hypothetical protein